MDKDDFHTGSELVKREREEWNTIGGDCQEDLAEGFISTTSYSYTDMRWL
jgi:hypothetical protein